VNVSEYSPDARLRPWQRTAAGAGLLADDGGVAGTIFAEMSALAARTGALNLGQGFPDEDGPREVLDAAREAIAEHQRRWYGLEFDADREVLVTAGATEALAATILALVDTGDDVVTFEPWYDAYGALVARSGGMHRTVPLRFPDWRPDHDELRAAVTDRTRVILVNSPHNPTGAVLDGETLALIVELATRHDAVIVTDEVYEHLTFGAAHTPIATLPGARERTVSISSGGKTFNTTGWKIGWITGPAELVTSVLAVKQYLTFVNGAPFQPAIALGLGLPDAVFAEAAAALRAKRDVLAAGLEAAGFGVSLPQAGYFIVADAASLGYADGSALCRELPSLAGVVGVPVSAFAHPDRRDAYASLVRFAFCKRREVLDEAAARLAALAAG